MPIPNPKGNETRKEYVNRCMDVTDMLEDYPDNKKRYAACTVEWTKSIKG